MPSRPPALHPEGCSFSVPRELLRPRERVETVFKSLAQIDRKAYPVFHRSVDFNAHAIESAKADSGQTRFDHGIHFTENDQ
jgi:hypothetical protein